MLMNYLAQNWQWDDFKNDIFNGIKLPNSCEEKILRLSIDNKLKFESYIRNVCKKAA